jgi:hypothetical protein
MNDGICYIAGIGFLFLAKAKHTLEGYRTPKPFGRSVDYDIHIAERYCDLLESRDISIEGKRILELGPGSDLGIGLYLVHRGAESYTGFDRFNLAGDVPLEFYEDLARRTGADIEELSRVHYVVSDTFDVSSLEGPFDIALSMSAFEHFDDIDAVASDLRGIADYLVADIDLITHSRWIRDVDPNNIYRYPQWLYDLFYFPGIPNRHRPGEYEQAFQRGGWSQVSVEAARRLEPERVAVKGDRMHWMSMVLTADNRPSA